MYNFLITKLIKIKLFKKIFISLSIRLSKIMNINRGFFNVNCFSMYLDYLDPIDRQIILFQKYEEDIFNFFEKEISKFRPDIFLDIGANCGYYSFMLSQVFKNLKILSFEPNSEAYSKLKNTKLKNPSLFKYIKIHNYGFSNKDFAADIYTKIKFGYYQTGGSSISNIIKNDKSFAIAGRGKFFKGDNKLSLKKKKLAIKIDVESHEFEVLDGFKNILLNNQCILIIEIMPSKFKSTNYFLIKNNFKKIKSFKDNNYFYKNFI